MLTGHDLEAVEPLLPEARDDLVCVALLVERPALDAVEDVDGASPRRARGGVGRVPAEHLAVHGREVDDGHRERAVHVEDHPAQRPPRALRGRRRGRGHDLDSGEGAAAAGEEGQEQAVWAEGEEHAWRDLGRWMARSSSWSTVDAVGDGGGIVRYRFRFLDTYYVFYVTTREAS